MIICLVFFFNAMATTEIYTLSLHHALPILAMRDGGKPGHESRTWLSAPAFLCRLPAVVKGPRADHRGAQPVLQPAQEGDRKSTRLNSSHRTISYAVFCLKKKTTQTLTYIR